MNPLTEADLKKHDKPPIFIWTTNKIGYGIGVAVNKAVSGRWTTKGRLRRFFEYEETDKFKSYCFTVNPYQLWIFRAKDKF